MYERKQSLYKRPSRNQRIVFESFVVWYVPEYNSISPGCLPQSESCINRLKEVKGTILYVTTKTLCLGIRACNL
jgi:hypothetical protein